MYTLFRPGLRTVDVFLGGLILLLDEGMDDYDVEMLAPEHEPIRSVLAFYTQLPGVCINRRHLLAITGFFSCFQPFQQLVRLTFCFLGPLLYILLGTGLPPNIWRWLDSN